MEKLLRLTESEIKIIKQTVQALDDQSKIYLFGSRVDSSKKGGDIVHKNIDFNSNVVM